MHLTRPCRVCFPRPVKRNRTTLIVKTTIGTNLLLRQVSLSEWRKSYAAETRLRLLVCIYKGGSVCIYWHVLSCGFFYLLVLCD